MLHNWRHYTLGEVAEALRANLLHPLREWRRRRGERARAEAFARELAADVRAYIAKHPATSYHMAELIVCNGRLNRGYARILDELPTFARWAAE